MNKEKYLFDLLDEGYKLKKGSNLTINKTKDDIQEEYLVRRFNGKTKNSSIILFQLIKTGNNYSYHNNVIDNYTNIDDAIRLIKNEIIQYWRDNRIKNILGNE